MPKIPVVGAQLTAEERKVRESERDLGSVFRALRAHDLESAVWAYRVAVERGGDEFLAYCQKLPAKMRAMLAEVVQHAAKSEKPRS